MLNIVKDYWADILSLFCSDKGLTLKRMLNNSSWCLTYPHQLSVNTIHCFTYSLHQCRSTLVLKGTSIPLIILYFCYLLVHMHIHFNVTMWNIAVIVPEHIDILHQRSWSVPLCLVCPKVAGTAESGRLTSKTITIIMASQLAIFVNYPSNRWLAFDCVAWCKFNVLIYIYISECIYVINYGFGYGGVGIIVVIICLFVCCCCLFVCLFVY